jgi:hypothetical protein
MVYLDINQFIYIYYIFMKISILAAVLVLTLGGIVVSSNATKLVANDGAIETQVSIDSKLAKNANCAEVTVVYKGVGCWDEGVDVFIPVSTSSLALTTKCAKYGGGKACKVVIPMKTNSGKTANFYKYSWKMFNSLVK